MLDRGGGKGGLHTRIALCSPAPKARLAPLGLRQRKSAATLRPARSI
jgi:hypothetical protein